MHFVSFYRILNSLIVCFLHIFSFKSKTQAVSLWTKKKLDLLSQWSTLCIDLISWTRKLFKGFLTLDGITLFATCKVRRIFTMKTDVGKVSLDGNAFSL